MINRVVLVGRLTRDPAELRRSANNVAVTSFTVAVDNRFARGEERSADFIPCVVFNKAAEPSRLRSVFCCTPSSTNSAAP